MMYDDVGEDKADAAVVPCVVGRGNWKEGETPMLLGLQ